MASNWTILITATRRRQRKSSSPNLPMHKASCLMNLNLVFILPPRPNQIKTRSRILFPSSPRPILFPPKFPYQRLFLSILAMRLGVLPTHKPLVSSNPNPFFRAKILRTVRWIIFSPWKIICTSRTDI